MRHAINVGLRHVEASHDYPWPPYIPGLFVAGAIIGPQRGGGGGGTATIGPGGGGGSYGGLSCHKWSPRTNYGSHNWSATGTIYGTRDCHSWSPRTDCGWDQLARDRPRPAGNTYLVSQSEDGVSFKAFVDSLTFCLAIML